MRRCNSLNHTLILVIGTNIITTLVICCKCLCIDFKIVVFQLSFLDHLKLQ